MSNIFLSKLENRLKSVPPLCVGLDGDLEKLEAEYSKDIIGLGQFLFDVVDATKEFAAAYKPNIAFFEFLGLDGLALLKELINKIPNEIPIILDFKRGDIGNTSKKYAEYAFNYLNVDAVTLAPYMGSDSVEPFLEYTDRYAYILGLTSNPGANDFEKLVLEDGEMVYQKVIKKINDWNVKYGNCGVVAGATRPEELIKIRKNYGEIGLLIPGVGAQGGDLKSALSTHKNGNGTSLINFSRAILYPSIIEGSVKETIYKNTKIIKKDMEALLWCQVAKWKFLQEDQILN